MGSVSQTNSFVQDSGSGFASQGVWVRFNALAGITYTPVAGLTFNSFTAHNRSASNWVRGTITFTSAPLSPLANTFLLEPNGTNNLDFDSETIGSIKFEAVGTPAVNAATNADTLTAINPTGTVDINLNLLNG